MAGFDLERRLTPSQFQYLCADLLEADGAKNIRGHGVGADQGSDFLADIQGSSPLGFRNRTYLVQCKRWSPPNAVGQGEVSEALTSLAVHGADALLIISTSGFSGTAVTKLNAFGRERADPLAAVFWDAEELSRRLWRNPQVVAKYLTPQPAANSGLGVGRSRLRRIGDDRIPARYDSVRLEHLVFSGDDERTGAAILDAAGRILAGKGSLVVLRGGLGSGKTTVACSLSRRFVDSEEPFYYCHYDYKEELFDLRYREDPSYLDRVNQLKQASCLVIDDLGEFLRDEAKTQVFAFDCLRDVIETRQLAGLPTVLAIYYDWSRLGSRVQQFIEALGSHGAVIELGEGSRRVVDASPSTVGEWRASATYFSPSWLADKLEGLERSVGSSLKILRTPEEEYAGQQRYLVEVHGCRPTTKQQELSGHLVAVIAAIARVRAFAEQLPFERIAFYPGGEVEIVAGSQRGDSKRE